MRRFFPFLFALCFLAPLWGGATLRDRLLKGSPGDFIVTAQGSNYSLLLIRDLKADKIVLEEVAIPQNLVDLEKVNWSKWIEKRAPGAISWISLSLDLKKNALSQIYSYFDYQWVFLEESEGIVKHLLTLPLRETKNEERKRIGPAQAKGEADRRKLWKPQLVREGKQETKADFTILRTTWPKDGSRLASSEIELYFDAKRTNFPFPYWLEVQSPHYNFKLRTVDSGSQIQSPMPSLQL